MARVLNRVSFKFIIISICLLWSVQAALATTVTRPLDDDMVIGARAIITGKVLQIESAIDERDNRIYTYITVRVNEVLKGQIAERKIVVKELGGAVGERATVVFGSPKFQVDEKVLLYLSTRDDGSLRTYQMFLGKFSIVTDEATGNRLAVRDSGGENVKVVRTLDAAPEGPSTDRMEISAYTNLVRARYAANIERSQAFEETYFKNVPVLATPPGFVKSKKQFQIDYTFLGNVRWFEPDTGQVVPYTVNPNPSSAPGAPQVVVDPNDIAAAAAAWSNVSGSALRIGYVGSMDNCYAGTFTVGINIVSNNCDGMNQPTSGCANILAIGGYTRGGSQTRVLGGITFHQMTQGFVSFNPWASCYFSDHCNLREIATHEMGHALGLAHTADPTGTMYAYAHFDGRCASLKQDDMNGIAFLYPGSGGPGPLTVSTTSLANGTLGTAYSQGLTATGGTQPYSWSIVAGLGVLPPGVSLSSAGTLSGTPTSSGTFNFTVKVTDATTYAQKALSIVVSATSALPLDSQFISQSTPSTLQPGQAFDVNVKFLNTGTSTWNGSLFYLASQNPALNQTWGGNAVWLNGFVVPPGQQLDVTFTASAPFVPGAYNFQWQLYMNDGSGFFGQKTTNVTVAVGVTQRFTDVPPSHPYFTYIDKIAQLGITVGCTPTTYCPNDSVSRDQMAVFIERVFGMMNPPMPPSQRFTDVPTNFWAYQHIGDFAGRGITVGCTPSTYCPGDVVLREQMAVFMERAAGRPNPPNPTSQRFSDVLTDHWAYAFIDSFIQHGQSGGIMSVIQRDCNPDGFHFCPSKPVTRAEMAAWLVIAFGL